MVFEGLRDHFYGHPGLESALFPFHPQLFQVTGQRQFAPAPEREAVDCRNDRLRSDFQGASHRMPKSADREIEIKLADVDRKNWESKAEYWQHSHTNLVENGFYHGTESPRMETACLIERCE